MALKSIYSRIVPFYESANRSFTLGLDNVWRKIAARSTSGFPITCMLDICCGTGDMTIEIIQVHQGKIVGVDFSKPMIDKAKRRIPTANATFILSDAEKLPFEDNTFDLVVISFATRNLYNSVDGLKYYLKEFKRVLRRGGLFLNLETTIPQRKIFELLMIVYVKIIVKFLGRLLTGRMRHYGFLSDSMIEFFTAPVLSKILCDIGFKQVQWMLLPPGVSAVHWAWKK